MWRITGNLGSFARSGVDASGWLWEIERDGEAKRVLVEVSGTALAVTREALPEETRNAIATEGESEMQKILDQEEPPRVIACGTQGCREIAASDAN